MHQLPHGNRKGSYVFILDDMGILYYELLSPCILYRYYHIWTQLQTPVATPLDVSLRVNHFVVESTSISLHSVPNIHSLQFWNSHSSGTGIRRMLLAFSKLTVPVRC